MEVQDWLAKSCSETHRVDGLGEVASSIGVAVLMSPEEGTPLSHNRGCGMQGCSGR